MLKRLLGLFRGRPVLIQGAGALEEGHARKISLGDPLAGTGCNVVLCRVDGKLHALDDICPHEGGRISDGPLHEGRLATCPLHMYHFDVSSGKAVGVACRKAKTYRVRERDGDCEVWL